MGRQEVSRGRSQHGMAVRSAAPGSAAPATRSERLHSRAELILLAMPRQTPRKVLPARYFQSTTPCLDHAIGSEHHASSAGHVTASGWLGGLLPGGARRQERKSVAAPPPAKIWPAHSGLDQPVPRSSSLAVIIPRPAFRCHANSNRYKHGRAKGSMTMPPGARKNFRPGRFLA